MGEICFDQTIMMIITIVLIAFILYGYFQYESLKNTICDCPKQNTPQEQQVKYIYPPIINPPRDIIRENDLDTLINPLQEPSRRHPLHRYDTRLNFNDSYSWLAYLIDDEAPSDDDNKILKLFGKEKYPSSTQYEYYVEVKSGGDRIKYFLEDQKRELYDDDTVYVDIIKRTYKVKLLKNRDLQYNPFI